MKLTGLVIPFIKTRIRPLVSENGKGTWRLTITCEIRGCHILDGDLLEEGRLLTARISAHHSGLLQPLTQPGQVTITDIGVGQEVTMETLQRRYLDSIKISSKGCIEYSQGGCPISLWLITVQHQLHKTVRFFIEMSFISITMLVFVFANYMVNNGIHLNRRQRCRRKRRNSGKVISYPHAFGKVQQNRFMQKKERVKKRMEKLETTIFLTFDNVLLHLGDFF